LSEVLRPGLYYKEPRTTIFLEKGQFFRKYLFSENEEPTADEVHYGRVDYEADEMEGIELQELLADCLEYQRDINFLIGG